MNLLRLDSEPLLANEEMRIIASFRATSGARRLQEAGRILDNLKIACKIAQEIWCYELDESLVRELKLEGLLLSDGEIPVLSPKNWETKAPMALPITQIRQKLQQEGKELCAILLGTNEKKEFERFLKKNNFEPADLWQLLELADHFFFPKNKFLKLALATRFRV